MRKYFYIVLILIFFVIAGIAGWRSQNTTTVPVTPPSTKPDMSLNPANTVPDKDGNIRVSIHLDAADLSAETVQFSLFFDPQSLQFQSFQSKGPFVDAEILEKEIDNTGYKCCHDIGKVTYKLKRITDKKVEKGEEIATIDFKAVRTKGQTGVRFLTASVDNQDLSKSLPMPGHNTTIKLGEVPIQ